MNRAASHLAANAPAGAFSDLVPIVEVARIAQASVKDLKDWLRAMDAKKGRGELLVQRGSIAGVRLPVLATIWPDLAKAIETERARATPMLAEPDPTQYGSANVESDLRDELYAIRHLSEQVLAELSTIRSLMSVA